MFQFSLLAYAIDTIEPIAKWLTLALVLLSAILGGVLFFVKRSALSRFFKILTVSGAAYFFILSVLLFVADLSYHYSDSYAEENWLDKQALVRWILLPVCLFFFLLLGSILLRSFAKNKEYSKQKTLDACLLFANALALIGLLVCLFVYYEKKIANDGYFNSDQATVRQTALWISTVLLGGLVFSLGFLDKKKLEFNAHALAYAGVTVAMSFALSYIKLWDMPYGGSVTLASLLPLCVYAYSFGVKKGLLVGFTYSLLQSMQDPWIIHPAQFLLDYPIAFTSIGLCGIFRTQKTENTTLSFTFGALFVGALRFIAHVLAGTFAFEAYAEGQNPFVYSLLYNSYVFIDILIVAVVGALLFRSNAFSHELKRLAER